MSVNGEFFCMFYFHVGAAEARCMLCHAAIDAAAAADADST